MLEELNMSKLTIKQKKELLVLFKKNDEFYCYDINNNSTHNIDCTGIGCINCCLNIDYRAEIIKEWEEEIKRQSKKRVPKKKDRSAFKLLKKFRGHSENKNKLRYVRGQR